MLIKKCPLVEHFVCANEQYLLFKNCLTEDVDGTWRDLSGL